MKSNNVILSEGEQNETHRKNELEARNLNSYSWEELKIIADDLSVNGRDSEYYTDVFEMTHDGSAKTFTTGSDILGEKMKVRIIGVCQDVKEDGTMAGLTFQTTHTLATTHAMNEDGTNADGWGKSSMREWLNNTVYDALPDELRENIVGVKKYYRNNAFGDDATIVNVVDKVFLASFKELYGYVELGQSWYEQEGTGENHNE
jgi:hypothetical protein